MILNDIGGHGYYIFPYSGLVRFWIHLKRKCQKKIYLSTHEISRGYRGKQRKET
jgi:hypothetical protein